MLHTPTAWMAAPTSDRKQLIGFKRGSKANKSLPNFMILSILSNGGGFVKRRRQRKRFANFSTSWYYNSSQWRKKVSTP